MVFVILLLYFMYSMYSLEGFVGASVSQANQETIQSKLADRTNPLAQLQNPLTNPAMPIGISAALAADLTTINQVALNAPSLVASQQVAPMNPIAPRVDNENSFLGMIQMCKTKGNADQPFSDPAFAANCGVCLSSGSLKTGEVFTDSSVTGVLVYAADKADAMADMKTNGYPFPRVVPSLQAAVCKGATKGDDSQPVLAITKKDYDAFMKRKVCRDGNQLGNECGRCIATSETSWVPSNGGVQAITLWLWGAGTVMPSIGGKNVSAGDVLSMTKVLKYELGKVKEGTTISINVTQGASADGPYVYGAITSLTVLGRVYKLSIDKFLELDTASGTFPRRGSPKYFTDVKVSCVKILPQANSQRMNLSGFLPLTFVENDQLAAYDCPGAPYVTTQESAEVMITDPCLNPRGQGPKNYTDECMQKTILDAGCSTNGSWYKTLPPMTERTFPVSQYTQILKWVNELFGESVPDVSMGCRGIDISTPCDKFLAGGTPDKTCLAYLYSNASEANKRVGRAYPTAQAKYTSLNTNRVIQFCQPGGKLNPEMNDNAVATLQSVSKGYNNYTGIEAIKRYLSDLYSKATSDLDIDTPDSKGGRRTSWENCIGMNVAGAPVDRVTENSKNDVIDTNRTCYPFPASIDLKEPTTTYTNIQMTGNYILSFDITPRSVNKTLWGCVIHFSLNQQDISRCPAIWFVPGTTQLHVRIGDMDPNTKDPKYAGAGTGWNWGQDTDSIPLNQKSSFRLECSGKDVKVTVNSQKFTLTQPTTRAAGTATVYIGGAQFGAGSGQGIADALIENICYTVL